ncbi:MAG: PAS domain S-box protein [Spirochaetales bacterium]|nr:PAS domain S-box protein [Spirochaetales bacterium]
MFLIQYIFKRLTKSIAAEIKLFSTYFDTAAEDSVEIDISEIKYNIFSHIAADINRMVIKKREADVKIYDSEQRFKLQREQSPLGYVEWDLNYRIIDWNASAERIFGYSREEVLGKGFEFLVSENIFEDIKSVFDSLIYETGGRKNINVNITKDNRKISCEWVNKVFTDKDGNILSIVSIVDDISKRKQMEDKLKASLDQKRILLKEVHHRVKNNMAIISSFISLQSMSVEDENVRHLLKNSENRVRSMALIHEHLYKSENLQDINVQKYVEELVMTLLDSYGFGEDEIKTTIEVLYFNLDLDRLIPLGMLINEIISNSLKHAFHSTTDPVIFLSLVKDDKTGYLLRVGDNGSGLPEDDILRQSDSIGFMLIEGLIQQINGKLEIIRNNGTEYRITIRE